jgi:lipopolysaccharide/colanic/teichoic acid biosynthesis glycosyltransferase
MIRRGCERALAAFVLICLLPLWGFIGLAIVLESGGPVLYGGPRVGKNGAPFRMWKFRSMYTGARGLLTEEQQRAFDRDFKLDADPRVTRVGQWLRALSLDELPQLLNVVRGEMAFVGPRPKLPEEIHLYGGAREELLSVLPGITGYWQVFRASSRSDGTMRDMDLYYVRHRSLRLDASLILRTLGVMAGRSNS